MILGFVSGNLLINKLTEMMLASEQSPQISQMFNKYLKHVNSNSTSLHENVQTELDNLTSDLEFEFGSFKIRT